MESVKISARIGRDLVEEIKKLASQKGVDKDSVIGELLSMAVRDEKLKEALELVRLRKITVWKGAKLAGISYRELLEELRARNIPFPLSEEELRNELEEIRS